MALKTAVNTFNGGLDKDLDKRAVKANTYNEGIDVTLTGDSNEMSIKPIMQGVLNGAQTPVGSGDSFVLASTTCSVDYTNPDTGVLTKENGIAYLIRKYKADPNDGGTISLVLYCPNPPSAFKSIVLFSIDYDLVTVTEHPESLSMFSFSENNEDFIYFTDRERFLRKIPSAFISGVTYSDEETRLIPSSIP